MTNNYTTMETFNEQHNEFNHSDDNLKNIIRINVVNHTSEAEDEAADYDFDYDPNEMYYALMQG